MPISIDGSGMSISLCPHTGRPLKTILGGSAYESDDGIIYVAGTHSLDYSEDYFLTEYKKQYGKTYIEDEPNLRLLAQRRLSHILKSRRPPAEIFEIGCATGFFLDEARKLGYSASGIEISPYASAHAREKLRLNVGTRAFLAEPVSERYDIVCAFYVIEHLPNQRAAFSAISEMLKSGGLFVFALPSSFGPTMRFDPDSWLSTHPCDHFADYSPRSLKKLLPGYGMRLLDARPASYHPQRARGLLRNRFLFRTYANLFCFGDTMEGIAIKT